MDELSEKMRIGHMFFTSDEIQIFEIDEILIASLKNGKCPPDKGNNFLLVRHTVYSSTRVVECC